MTIILDWLNTPAFTLFDAPTTWAEVLGFITGAWCVWLVAKQNIWNWPVGIANNVLWIVLFMTAGLYADSGLQVVYIALAVWGWWMWLHGGEQRTELRVSRTSSRQWVALALIGAASTAGMMAFLDAFTGSTVPFWDALTTVISLLAVWGQVKKKIESWCLWMLADLIYIPLYHYKGLTLTALLYVGFFALCVYGYVKWRKELHADEKAARVEAVVLEPAGRL